MASNTSLESQLAMGDRDVFSAIPDSAKVATSGGAVSMGAFSRLPTIKISNKGPKGRRFTIVTEGEDDQHIDEDSLQLIVLSTAINFFETPNWVARAYRDVPFSPDNPRPPVCTSKDGVAPSDSSTDPQSATCRSCPKKNRTEAGGGQYCKWEKYIMVCPASDPKTVYQMKINPTSIWGTRGANKGLHGWVNDIRAQGLPTRRFVATVYWDVESNWPKLFFGMDTRDGNHFIADGDPRLETLDSYFDEEVLKPEWHRFVDVEYGGGASAPSTSAATAFNAGPVVETKAPEKTAQQVEKEQEVADLLSKFSQLPKSDEVDDGDEG